MSKKNLFITIIIIFFSINSFSKAQDNIAFIDLNIVFDNSSAGKKINKDIENKRKQNNKNFTETISFKSKYNRAIFFDSGHWHSANISFDKNEKNDRLTLIGFYRNFLNTKFHVVENNRI